MESGKTPAERMDDRRLPSLSSSDMTLFGWDAYPHRAALQRFSPYVATGIDQALEIGDPKKAQWVYNELAAELSAAAMTQRPVPRSVYDLAQEHYPQAFMDKIGPHLNVEGR